jgi:hypothetical protein
MNTDSIELSGISKTMNIIKNIRYKAEREAVEYAACRIVGSGLYPPKHLVEDILEAVEKLRPRDGSTPAGLYRGGEPTVLGTIALGILGVGDNAEKHAEEKVTAFLIAQP